MGVIPDLDGLDVSELLRLYATLMNRLRTLGVIRSTNNPVADYTEHLVTTKLGLTQVTNSVAGYDALDVNGRRYQIKGRRLTPQNSSTELSAIRNFAAKPFDLLVAVVYRPDFAVDYAGIVPYEVVGERSKYVKHTNSNRFLMKRAILDDPRVEDITARLTAHLLPER
jgi:hypothetical protein